MMLALTFGTWPLLIGLLAAAIPFILHLLSSVRAQDMMFPTLRFLRRSMEKTARRRRLQHWLLLLLRAVLFALLALCVAEPISDATGGWLSGKRFSAVIVLDNSYSMAVNGAAGNRFERAKAQVTSLLSGDEKPSLAALLTTNGQGGFKDLTGDLQPLRAALTGVKLGYDQPRPLKDCFKDAIELLATDTSPRRAIYLFSDLQRTSFSQIAEVEDLAAAEDIHVLVVDTSSGKPSNVGISNLEIAGRRVVDSTLEFTATLVNSSPSPKTAVAAFQIDGSDQILRLPPKTLAPAGSEGATATARFTHRFTEAGAASGKVFLETTDDLALDNVHWFSLSIGGRVKALVVQGPGDGFSRFEPGSMLRLALQPLRDESRPWPIRQASEEYEAFDSADLKSADIAFFCEVPRFSEVQARAIRDFTAGGGTTVFFLGPGVEIDNYNLRLIQQIGDEGGLLPAKLGEFVGQVGPEAPSIPVAGIKTDHPYLSGLYEDEAGYLTVLVQRYCRLASPPAPENTLMSLVNGDPLMQVKRFGGGRVVLCTTTAGPNWSNLPIQGLFLPMVVRMGLLARHEMGLDPMYPFGQPVSIQPDLSDFDIPAEAGKLLMKIQPPNGGKPELLAMQKKADGYRTTYKAPPELGRYEWEVRWDVTAGGGEARPAGAFAVNAYGPECLLDPLPAGTFRQTMANEGLPRVYVASTLADVHAAATAESEGKNWWDLLLAMAIIVLVFEAIVANRGGGERAVPAHLQPDAPQ